MSIEINAFYLPTHIDLKQIKARFPDRCAHYSDPLVMVLEEHKHVCITSFGAVVFWPFEQALSSRVMSELEPFFGGQGVVKQVSDELIVTTATAETEVLFDEIRLKGEPERDQIILISQLLAQSVALDYLTLEVDKALDRIEKHVSNLRRHGRLNISIKGVFKNIGFAMDIRHRVLTSLALFDKPASIWESETLEQLYDALYNHFDIEDRHRSIARKLSFISENTSFLYEFLSTEKSHKLEWIIIFLIAAEIAMFLVSELFIH